MPADTGAAFVVIMHLNPGHTSMASEVIGRFTEMPVAQIGEGDQLQPNHVYVIPPDHYLYVRDGVFHLTEPGTSRWTRTPIDYFLRSLAEQLQRRAVCIILSGTGADGTLGLKAVKAEGGLCLAQSPESAMHDGMPRNAIGTGLVDRVLAPPQMGDELVAYLKHPYVRSVEPAAEAETEKADLNSVLGLLRARTRYDFRSYKRNMLARRTARRMSLHQITSFPEYLRYMREHSKEVDALIKDLLISVTDFFREPEAWDVLAEKVLAPMVDAKADDEPIRVWVPACATGEEPYSLAMLLIEQLQRAEKACPLMIFATDIDRAALDSARGGVYPTSISADVSPDRIKRFFTDIEGDHRYQINKSVREAVVFAEQNLISDPPFSRLDLICCRNLMIYLQPDIQQRILGLFHFALRDGGAVFLGNAETIGQQTDLFSPISQKWRIYRRIGSTRRDRVEFPIVPSTVLPEHEEPAPRQPTARRMDRWANLARQRLLDQFVPAAVLVDAHGEILYFCGPTDDYLTQPAGTPTRNLLDRARQGLRVQLRGLIHQALQDKVAVSAQARVKRGGKYEPVQLTVTPIVDTDRLDPTLLVVFEELPEPTVVAETHAQACSDAKAESVVRQLEAELTGVREQLQHSIEQLETSNEEYKASNEEVMSMNEELQSTNEELETSKEELQSLNEELSTVNNELSNKVDELQTRNNDLTNLLSSSDIATICLDAAARIRWFTAPATDLMRIQPSDKGRPISDFAQRFDKVDLQAHTDQVLRTLHPKVAEVQTDDGRWYLRRVQPYRTEDNHIDGVVVTFFNITERKQIEQERLLRQKELEDEVARRTATLKLLQAITRIANEARTVESALGAALRCLCDHHNWQVGHIWRPAQQEADRFVSAGVWCIRSETDYARLQARCRSLHVRSGAGLIGRVCQSGRPVWIPDLQTDAGEHQAVVKNLPLHAAAAFPILVEGRLDSVVTLYGDRVMDPDEDYLENLTMLAGQIVPVIERKRLERRVAELIESERRHIGSELHDSLGQQLASLGLMAAGLRQQLARGDDEACARRADDLVRITEESKQIVGNLLDGILPAAVEGAGLISTLKGIVHRLGQRYDLNIELNCRGAEEIEDKFLAAQLSRIAQEAILNAARHARAHQITVTLTDGGQPQLIVRDDGIGMTASEGKPKGNGLRIMQYRADLIGATLTIDSSPDQGTTITCALTTME